MRLFVAVNFNEDTIRQLAALRDELRDNATSGNFTLTENLHLTLAFIGECNGKQAEIIKTAMDKIDFRPFSINMENVGKFKRIGGDIWWVGIAESKPLIKLQSVLTDELAAAGFNLDKRAYNPHITLGRKVVACHAPIIENPQTIEVAKIDLMKSERVSGKLIYAAIHTKGAKIL